MRWLMPLAISLTALSGLPGLFSRRARWLGDTLAALLLVAGCLLGLVASAVGFLHPEALRVDLAWSLPGARLVLRVDALAATFLAPLFAVAALGAVYGLSYWREQDHPASARGVRLFYGLTVAGMALLLSAANAVLFLVGWELMTLAAFALVGAEHERSEVRHASLVYLAVTRGGTLCLFAFFALLHAVTGSLDLDLVSLPGRASPVELAALFVLALLGFGMKAGFMPLHVWLPGAHANAPSHVSALMSGVLIKMGIYGLVRFTSFFPSPPLWWGGTLVACGIVSGIAGVAFAIGQHDLKRLLAYHSVENIGIIGLGIGMGMLGQATWHPAVTALGYGGALLHVLNHALFKGLLFLSAGAVIHGTGTGNIERLGGLARKTPVNAALFLIAALAICALPPLNGFVSEWLVYGSMLGGAFKTSGAASGIAVLGTVSLALIGGLALACFAKAFGVIFLGEPRDASIKPHTTPGPMRLGMALLAACCIAIGVLPGFFVPLTATGVAAVSRLASAEIVRATTDILIPAGRLSLAAAVLIGITAALTLARWALLRRNMPTPAAKVRTWGCGYAAPTARMQYTASSFAWSLVHSFRYVLWPDRAASAPTGVFPGHAHLETHTPDMAENDFFTPLFRGAARVFRMIRTVSWSGAPSADIHAVPPSGRVNLLRLMLEHATRGLRRGSIQVYLMFMVLALLVVFLVEVFVSPGSFDPSAVQSLPGVAP